MSATRDPETARGRSRREALVALRDRVIERIGALLAAGRPYALVDFPNYPNVGDSAIYLGQLACLRALGHAMPCYVSDFRSYDATVMRRRVGDGPILLTGGGSFGDVWPTGQTVRESILEQFRGNAIIQLPQTLHFREHAKLERARRAVNGHPSFTLLVRDGRSHELARTAFEATTHLCPDMAFALGALERTRAPGDGVLWLSRTDRESAIAPLPGAGRRADWLVEAAPVLRAMSWRLGTAAHWRRAGRWIHPLLLYTYERLAQRRVRLGLDTLDSARALITDRLHGHILALLLGVPHVVLDNAHGKLSSFHETWTAGIEGVHRADSAEAAWALASELADDAAAGATGTNDG